MIAEVRIKTISNAMSCMYNILFSISYFVFYVENTILLTIRTNVVFSNVRNSIYIIILFMTLLYLLLQLYGLMQEKRKENQFPIRIVIKLSIIIATTWFYSFKGDNGFCSLILLSTCSNLQTENRILKNGFCIGVVLNTILFILSITGFITNIRNNSFGFIYGDHYACYLLCLMLFYCILKDGRLTWVEEIGMIAVPVFSLFIGGRMAALCQILTIICTFYRHYIGNNGVPFQKREQYGGMIPVLFRAIYLPICLMGWVYKKTRLHIRTEHLYFLIRYSYIGIAIFITAATYSFHYLWKFWNRLPLPETFIDRLYYGRIAFEEVPLTLFGNTISQKGSGATERFTDLYFMLDSSYIKTILEYGVVMFIIIIGLMTWTLIRMQKERRLYASVMIAVFALDVLMEFQLTCFTYNLFIFLAFCKLSEKPGIKACNEWNFENLSKVERWCFGIGIAMLILILSLWSVTAYQITSWRGWTPDYDATALVLPNGGEQLLECSRAYLNSHPNTACIVCSNDEKNWLIANGISGNRITLQEKTGVDEILLSAHELIKANNMPPRLTVCAYNVQQARICKRAEYLHIPVNSLTIKPRSGYLCMLAEEQWRLLWGD